MSLLVGADRAQDVPGCTPDKQMLVAQELRRLGLLARQLRAMQQC